MMGPFMSINGQGDASQACASERLMGTLGVEEIDVSVHPQVFGGLGLGFTCDVVDAVGPMRRLRWQKLCQKSLSGIRLIWDLMVL